MKVAEKWSGSHMFVSISLIALYIWSLVPVVSSAPDRPLQPKVPSRQFSISNDLFWKDDHPFQIIGGELHYFRVLPLYWEDRLLRAKALGLNTIQTNVPWNLHEPLPGKWNFDGIADIEHFLKTSDELGFLVMLRVGPYICAEWDLGGFPPWLLAIEPELRLRSSDPAFLNLVERWWNVLLAKVVPFLYENGGPVIMVQIENEFGSYGNDQPYLHHLVSLARRQLGNKVVLYTTDGGYFPNLEQGTVHGEDVFAAVDFSTGEDAWSSFGRQKMFNAPGKSPPMSSEFYTGWLTHWGEHIAETDADFTAQELGKILSQNGSVVLYMAHGGTNFGFFNGANTGQNALDYLADLTSYDYDAPIKESGDVDNSKFKALRRTIKKFSMKPLPPIPTNNKKTRYGNIEVKRVASLFDVLNSAQGQDMMVQSESPIYMELVGQMFGFLMYMSEYFSTEGKNILSIPEGFLFCWLDSFGDGFTSSAHITGSIILLFYENHFPHSSVYLELELESETVGCVSNLQVHDRGQVFIACSSSGKVRYPSFVGVIERWSNREIIIPSIQCTGKTSLYILVENMGRLNYGPFIFDRKGILSDVMLDGTILKNWKMFPIPFSNLGNLSPTNPLMQFGDYRTDNVSSDNMFANNSGIPGFYKGSFTIGPAQSINDTFISLRGWNKGVVFINDFNIGRFWPSVGPQCNLYVPAPILRHGENVVVIFELHDPNPSLTVGFVKHPDFSCGIRSRPS